MVAAITKEARNMFKQMEENGFQNTHKNKQVIFSIYKKKYVYMYNRYHIWTRWFKLLKKRQELYGLENKEAFKTTSTMLDLFRRLEKEPDGYLGIKCSNS